MDQNPLGNTGIAEDGMRDGKNTNIARNYKVQVIIERHDLHSTEVKWHADYVDSDEYFQNISFTLSSK